MIHSRSDFADPQFMALIGWWSQDIMQACRKQVVKQTQRLEAVDSQTRLLSGANFVPEPADWDLGFGNWDGDKGGKSFHSAGN
jgi:hypothetical protein